MSGPLVALVGLPDTGKTTYLVAVWNAVQSPAEGHSLSLERYPTAAVYLDDMHARWLRGERVGHTPRDGSELVELALKFNDRPFDLEVPDLSGETFEQMVVERSVTSEVDELLLRASGALVFVHPDHLRPRLTIVEADALGATASSDAEPTAPPLDRRMLPAEVHAVDLIHAIYLRRRAEFAAPARIAIIVSAWDSVADEKLDPSRWVEKRMPMLHAYLRSRSGDSHRVFGASAQGGDAGPAVAEKDPVSRAWVVEAAGDIHHDIAAPLVWAAGLK